MAILEKVFRAAVDFKASDVHVVPNEPIIFRQLGRLRKLKNPPLTPDQCKKYVYEILSPEQRKKLEENLQLDFAIEGGRHAVHRTDKGALATTDHSHPYLRHKRFSSGVIPANGVIPAQAGIQQGQISPDPHIRRGAPE